MKSTTGTCSNNAQTGFRGMTTYRMSLVELNNESFQYVSPDQADPSQYKYSNSEEFALAVQEYGKHYYVTCPEEALYYVNTPEVKTRGTTHSIRGMNEEGGVVTTTYDAFGQVTQVVNEDGAVTSYTYDAKGRVTKIKDAHGNSRYIEYDPMDRIIADIDENGIRRTYEYDTLNRVISETDPLGNTKYFGYNKNSEIVSVTGRCGNILNNDYGNYVYSTYTARCYRPY